MLCFFDSELPNRSMARKLIGETLPERTDIRRHETFNPFDQIHKPFDLFSSSVCILCPIGSALRSCKFSDKFTRDWPSVWECRDCCDKGKQFLVFGAKMFVFCSYYVALVLWSNSHVCFFACYGHDFAFVGYKL